MAEVDQVPYKDGPSNQTGQGFSYFDRGYGTAMGLVDRFSGQLGSVLNSLSGAVASLQSIGGGAPDHSGPIPPPSMPTPPSIDEDLTVPDAPTPLSVGDMPTPRQVSLGDPDLPAPELCGDLGSIDPQFPARPTVPSVDTTVGDVNIPDFVDDTQITTPPAVPDISLPPVPGVSTISVSLPDAPNLDRYIQALPDIPPLQLPDTPAGFFDVPTIDITVPEPPVAPNWVAPEFVVDEFASSLMDTLASTVETMVTTAQLDQSYEQASFDAVMAREAEAAHAALGGLPDQWAARGFPLPPGMFLEQEREIREKMQQQARVGSREIYYKRKEQELQVRQTALQTGATLVGVEAQVYEVYNRLRAEAVQFAERQIQLTYELLLKREDLLSKNTQLRIEAFRARLEGVKARWDAFTTQVNAEVAKLEAVNAQIRAIASQAGIAQAEASVYSASVDAQVKVAQLGVEADKLQFQAWGSQVEAEVQRLKAYSTYGDIIRAQAAAIDARAKAYQARVQGAVAKVEADATRIKAQTEVANLAISLYEAEVRAEASRVAALADVVRTKAAVQEYAARYAVAYAQALVAYREGEARVNAALIQATASSYQAKVNSHAAEQNALLAWFNAHSSRFNVIRAKADIQASFFRSSLESIITAYRSQVDYTDREYSRALATWSTSVQRQLSAIQAVVNTTAAQAQYPARVAAAALNQVVVQLSSQEQTSYSEYAGWQYSLSNRLSRSSSTVLR